MSQVIKKLQSGGSAPTPRTIMYNGQAKSSEAFLKDLEFNAPRLAESQEELDYLYKIRDAINTREGDQAIRFENNQMVDPLGEFTYTENARGKDKKRQRALLRAVNTIYTGLGQSYDATSPAKQAFDLNLMGRIQDKYFGGNRFNKDVWNLRDYDEATKQTLGLTNRTNLVADVLDGVIQEASEDPEFDNKYDFSTSVFKTKDTYFNNLRNVSSKLRDGTFNKEDLIAASESGINLKDFQRLFSDATYFAGEPATPTQTPEEQARTEQEKILASRDDTYSGFGYQSYIGADGNRKFFKGTEEAKTPEIFGRNFDNLESYNRSGSFYTNGQVYDISDYANWDDEIKQAYDLKRERGTDISNNPEYQTIAEAGYNSLSDISSYFTGTQSGNFSIYEAEGANPTERGYFVKDGESFTPVQLDYNQAANSWYFKDPEGNAYNKYRLGNVNRAGTAQPLPTKSKTESLTPYSQLVNETTKNDKSYRVSMEQEVVDLLKEMTESGTVLNAEKNRLPRVVDPLNTGLIGGIYEDANAENVQSKQTKSGYSLLVTKDPNKFYVMLPTGGNRYAIGEFDARTNKFVHYEKPKRVSRPNYGWLQGAANVLTNNVLEPLDEFLFRKEGGTIDYNKINDYQNRVIKAQNGTLITGVKRNKKEPYWYNEVYGQFRDNLGDQFSNNQLTIDDINMMQRRHAGLSNQWGTKGDAYFGDDVKQYQTDINSDRLNFVNQRGITNAFNKNIYGVSNNANTGDNTTKGFVNDGRYSSITDDRRLLGRQGDFTDDQLKQEQEYWRGKNAEMYLDPETNYYMLKGLTPPTPTAVTDTPIAPPVPTNTSIPSTIEPIKGVPTTGTTTITPSTKDRFKSFLGKIKGSAPDIWSAARFVNSQVSNRKRRDIAKDGIKPLIEDMTEPYLKVVGNLPLKQAYTAQGNRYTSMASRPITSDASRTLAGRLEAQRLSNQAETEGILQDNNSIRETGSQARQLAIQNQVNRMDMANRNKSRMLQASQAKNNIDVAYESAKAENWNNLFKEREMDARVKQERGRQFQLNALNNELSRDWDREAESWQAKQNSEYQSWLKNNPKGTFEQFSTSKEGQAAEKGIAALQKEYNQTMRDRTIREQAGIYGVNINIPNRKRGWIPFSRSGSKLTYKERASIENAKNRTRVNINNSKLFHRGIEKSIDNNVKTIRNLSAFTKELILKAISVK